MASSFLEDLAEQAQAAADLARAAADQAQVFADQALEASRVDPTSVVAHSPFVFEFAIFVLAIFVGYFVVWAVTPALHTPLMSVTNAISSVIVVGALLAVLGGSGAFWATLFGFLALVLASVNIFGGFFVTHRMLLMYKKKGG